jgi:hypothetical protein
MNDTHFFRMIIASRPAEDRADGSDGSTRERGARFRSPGVRPMRRTGAEMMPRQACGSMEKWRNPAMRAT